MPAAVGPGGAQRNSVTRPPFVEGLLPHTGKALRYRAPADSPVQAPRTSENQAWIRSNTAKQQGSSGDAPVVKTGRFSVTEKEAIRSAIRDFVDTHHLSAADLPALLSRRRGAQRVREGEGRAGPAPEVAKVFWKEIAGCLPERSIESIYHCARRLMDERNTGEKFTIEDDQQLLHLVSVHGRRWETIGEHMGRLGVAVKDRFNYLDACSSETTTRQWTLAETRLLKELVAAACLAKGYSGYREAHEQRMAIPWTEISAKIGTKNAYQCRQKFSGRVRKLLVAEEQGLVASEVSGEAAETAEATPEAPAAINAESYLAARPHGRKGAHVLFEWTLEHLVTLCDRLREQKATDESDVDWNTVASGPLGAWTSTHLRNVWIRHAQQIANLESHTFRDCVRIVQSRAEEARAAGRTAISYGRPSAPESSG